VLSWTDELRRLGVRANADTPEDARRAREFGAEGIGLCRTEHMFMAADRQPKMQAMILASSTADRRHALEQLLPLQRSDFEALFEEMAGLPVTIRLLDPSLHEFLPNATNLALEIERARTERPHDARRLQRVYARVRELEETNPMLGTRGARLGIIAPEIYDVQVEAITAAALAVQARHGTAPQVRSCSRSSPTSKSSRSGPAWRCARPRRCSATAASSSAASSATSTRGAGRRGAGRRRCGGRRARRGGSDPTSGIAPKA